jgi:hypothetical protein
LAEAEADAPTDAFRVVNDVPFDQAQGEHAEPPADQSDEEDDGMLELPWITETDSARGAAGH